MTVEEEEEEEGYRSIDGKLELESSGDDLYSLLFGLLMLARASLAGEDALAAAALSTSIRTTKSQCWSLTVS